MADDDSNDGGGGGPLDRISAAEHGSHAENNSSADDRQSDQRSDDESDKSDSGDDTPAPKPAPPPPPDPNIVAGTPCTKTARACVDLGKQQAWLIDATGKVTMGPVGRSSGGPGAETPIGTFAVRWKDKTHVSKEYKNPQGQPAPMPYSVFFTPGGVAFHGGSVTRASAGCVHLDDADAQTFYNTLKLGDQVQVH